MSRNEKISKNYYISSYRQKEIYFPWQKKIFHASPRKECLFTIDKVCIDVPILIYNSYVQCVCRTVRLWNSLIPIYVVRLGPGIF